ERRVACAFTGSLTCSLLSASAAPAPRRACGASLQAAAHNPRHCTAADSACASECGGDCIGRRNRVFFARYSTGVLGGASALTCGGAGRATWRRVMCRGGRQPVEDGG